MKNERFLIFSVVVPLIRHLAPILEFSGTVHCCVFYRKPGQLPGKKP
jgi:hypothetical protein